MRGKTSISVHQSSATILSSAIEHLSASCRLLTTLHERSAAIESVLSVLNSPRKTSLGDLLAICSQIKVLAACTDLSLHSQLAPVSSLHSDRNAKRTYLYAVGPSTPYTCY